MRTLLKTLTAAAILSAFGLSADIVQAKEYILTGVKPNKLVVIDVEEMKISKVIEMKDSGTAPATIVPTKDGKRAFVMVNKMEAIVEIDLISGKELSKIQLSSDDIRVKALFGMDLSPDGSTLVTIESAVKILPGEFSPMPTRISFYDTKTGELKAQQEAPRQITLMAYSTDGSKVYGLGRALHIFDAKTGKKIGEHKTQEWGRKNFYNPDILAVWAQWENSGVLSTPYYVARSDMDLANPEAYWTGMLTLDLNTGAFNMKDIENTDIFYFSTSISPTDKNIAFGAYNQLSKMNVKTGKALKRVELPHSYYSVNLSSDGKKVFIGGAMSDIAFYDTETLKRIGTVKMPGEANMSLSSLRVFQR